MKNFSPLGWLKYKISLIHMFAHEFDIFFLISFFYLFPMPFRFYAEPFIFENDDDNEAIERK